MAYSGPANSTGATLCLLDGFLDNALELGAELAVDAVAGNEGIIAEGWRRWGMNLLGRMRGDFVLLLWDELRGEGLIARDQLGVRSIFLHDGPTGTTFASEIRNLLAVLPRRPAPDSASVAHWLSLSNRPGPATMYEGIRRLDPGTALLLGPSGVREHTYWAPRYAEPLDSPEPALAHLVRAELGRAVRRRISPGGRTGVLMSGGLDSSSVAAVAAAEAPGEVSAFSAVFPDHPAVDESDLINELRRKLNLPGVAAQVRSGGLLASAMDSALAWEAPLRGWGDFWSLPLLRAAAESGVSVSLGGDGGDELFGARLFLLADRLRSGHPLQALDLTRELPGAGDRPARRAMARIFLEIAVAGALPPSAQWPLQRELDRRRIPAWLKPDFARELVDTDDSLEWKRLDGPRWWAHIAHGLTRGVEEAGVFEGQRRRAESAGLHARFPLFDLDLLELCLRLPPLTSFDRHRSRPVLRASMAGLLPDSVRMRPQKALFDSLLIGDLAGTDGRAVRNLLTSQHAEVRAYVDADLLQRELFSGQPEAENRTFRWMWHVWRLVAAECWLQVQAGQGETLRRSLSASVPNVTLEPVRINPTASA